MRLNKCLQNIGVISRCILRNLEAYSIGHRVQGRLPFSICNNTSGRNNSADAVRSLRRSLHVSSSSLMKDSVTVTFIDRNDQRVRVQADVGETLLDVAKDNDIDGVEGACGGTLSCSTCHCVFHQVDFDRLGFSDELTDDELDMLDLAYGLTDTSRLVCSVELTEDMDGIEITVPKGTNDARDL